MVYQTFVGKCLQKYRMLQYPKYGHTTTYAISLSAPVSRMTDQRVAELRAPLMAARDEIARALGGSRF